jgi:hypothetical protein
MWNPSHHISMVMSIGSEKTRAPAKARAAPTPNSAAEG